MDLIKNKDIQSRIYTVRGIQTMLDSDLALLYGTETKFINRAIKRNPSRFPDSFVFQLSEGEWNHLKFQLGTSNSHGGRRTLPFVFTEQGVAMLSSVLNTETAIQASVQIMQAFVSMRTFLIDNASVFQRLDHIETRQLQTDEKIEHIFQALESGQPKPDKGIFFDGQMFDAYVFVAERIKSATRDIILIDTYIDESVLMLLSKRNPKVKATIYTKTISKQLQLDLKKHNTQYPPITITQLTQSHDRFLIIDQTELYHIGASLKDLGNKWFAFSKMDHLTEVVLSRLKDTG